MSVDINNAICSAVDTIATRAIEKAGYDRTIQATIVECTDATIGKYKVRYQDTLFYAYATSADVTYANKASVYILVPGNDFKQEKTIIGTVQKLGINYIPVVSEKDSYELNGANCVRNSDNKIQLTSYEKYGKVIFDKKNGVNLLNIDEEALKLYLCDSKAMLCTMTVKNNIPTAQRYQGNYGIKFNLAFKNNEDIVIRSYVFDNSQMVGNPYKFITPSTQTKAFKIDGINFSHIESIEVFAESFPLAANRPDNTSEDYWNILLSNIEIAAGNQLTNDELTGYKLTFLSVKGVYFTAADTDNKQLPIQAQVRIKGKVAASDSSQIKYYWFRENSRVDASSKYYTPYGGKGWECLNRYNIINDTMVEYVPGTYEYIAEKKNFPAKETVLKCCAVYNDDTIITNTISIKNLGSNIGVSITSLNGNQFYYDSGETVLTCIVDRVDNNENISYNYYWGVSDNNNYFTSINEATNEITVAAKDITDFSRYICTVYQDNLFIGSAQMTIYNILEAPREPMVVINGGTKVFKYNTAGVSPTAQSQDNPEILTPLTFTIFDEERKIITAQCDSISWKIPKEDTMISLPKEISEKCEVVDGYYLYSGNELTYSIRDKYNIDYNNNDIILAIECRDLKLVTQTHFTFTKEGEIGTNGTDYFCKIVINPSPTSEVPIRPAIINGKLNYQPYESGKWFKAKLWENNVEVTDFKEEWKVLKNKYTSSISDKSHISYTKENGFSINANVEGAAADIVQVKVTYDNKDYYAVMPIVWIETVNGIELDWKQRTGFNSVMYQTDGTKPIYNDAYPFELTSIDGAKYIWDVNGEIYHNKEWVLQNLLKITSETNKATVKPAPVYDGYCVNTSVSCHVQKDGLEIAYINIPIHMYLNRFGQELLNGWDGNSIQLNEEGGAVYSPQVGAGAKDSNNRFTGVLMGKVQEHNNSEELIGLLGYNEGVRSIFLDSRTGKAEFGKVGGGQIIIDPTSDTAKIYSGNYSTTKKTGMLIDLTTPEIKFGSGYFNVDKNGNLTAKNAKLEDVTAEGGKFNDIHVTNLEAVSGTIGGWTIGADTLTGGSVTLKNTGEITGSKWNITSGGVASFEDVNITGGQMNWGNNFNVNDSGILTAKGANITGVITATEGGDIGGWKISTNKLTSGDSYISASGQLSLFPDNGGRFILGLGTSEILSKNSLKLGTSNENAKIILYQDGDIHFKGLGTGEEGITLREILSKITAAQTKANEAYNKANEALDKANNASINV